MRGAHGLSSAGDRSATIATVLVSGQRYRPGMSDIERLRVVATVARTHSISEAARVHGIAQSTVTRSVAKTEQLVGFPLFRRTAEGARPTTAAQSAITVIERIVSGFDELRALGEDRPASLRLAHRRTCRSPPASRTQSSCGTARARPPSNR